MIRKTGGIAAIYRANAVDLIVFGAVNFQRKTNPTAEVRETIKNVAEVLGLRDEDLGALETGFYRTQKAFCENNGL